jgi:hypothetical protein
MVMHQSHYNFMEQRHLEKVNVCINVAWEGLGDRNWD